MRTFTTDGPGDATRHHLLPAAPRLAEIVSLVEQGRYVVFRAPPRSGKTTALRSIAADLTAEGRFAALCCSTKVASAALSDLALAQNSIISAIRIAAEQDLPAALRPPVMPSSTDLTAVWDALTAWAKVCPLPIVLFFDDGDSLSRPIIESLFRQFEAGFARRPAHFPWSIGIVMQFDARQHASSSDDESVHSISSISSISTGPFESFWASRLLPPFTRNEIRALYAQGFGPSEEQLPSDAIEFVYQASAGHPYIVQALGREISSITPLPSRLTLERATCAFRTLVDRLDSPIHNLAQHLVDPRVRHVIEPLLQGHSSIASVSESDVQFVRDLGLIAADDPIRIDGALHRAILPRILAAPIRRAITVDPQLCFDGDGRLYMDSLLQSFASFFTTNAAELLPTLPYSKIASELVFLGFLLQILQGRGWVDVEFGTSRGRIDIAITLPLTNTGAEPSEQREVIVLAARRKGDSGIKRKALEWLEKVMLRASSDSGTVVFFDKRSKRRPGERSKLREMATIQGKTCRALRI